MPVGKEQPIPIEPFDLGVDLYDEPGHGIVTPRSDGAKANCGGPRVCEQCAREQRTLDATKAIAAHAATVEVDLGLLDGDGDYHVKYFREALASTAAFRADLPLQHALVHVSLLGAAIQTCDVVECRPEQTAETALAAVIPHLKG